ncbi:hypothetical protein VTJ83DRAFT_964 [Remersonia thermophila]|uniref:Uncharacterized protein n=1 Tax=Remersonia thermophila TaxID=72144 RepID=A0ABR4DMU3_9PEZI
MSLLPPYPVLVHNYLPSTNPDPTRPLQAYEHLPFPSSFSSSSSSSSSPSPHPRPAPENALVFLCGLGDGPHTIPYARRLAERLAAAAPRWSVFEARLASNFSAFGCASLRRDAEEVRDLVRYLRGPATAGAGRSRVVLMGHSTGCQDCLEYARLLRRGTDKETETETETEPEVRVDGYVLQGPVSDREAIAMGEDAGEVAAAVREAEEMRRQGRGDEVMPAKALPKGWRGSPVTAYRWWSLAAVGGDDDYFSSDLPDARLAEIWGGLDVPVLVVPSAKEEWVPASLDVPAMVKRWKSFARPGIVSELSGMIPGANHRVDNDEGQEWLADRVARFLHEVEGRM